MYRLGILAALCCAAAASAQNLDTVTLGEAVLGGKPDLSALKGRVVVIEMWGVH